MRSSFYSLFSRLVFCLCHHHSHPNLIEVPASKTLQKKMKKSAEKNHVDIQRLSPKTSMFSKKQKNQQWYVFFFPARRE
jgi:hypothetical protein